MLMLFAFHIKIRLCTCDQILVLYMMILYLICDDYIIWSATFFTLICDENENQSHKDTWKNQSPPRGLITGCHVAQKLKMNLPCHLPRQQPRVRHVSSHVARHVSLPRGCATWARHVSCQHGRRRLATWRSSMLWRNPGYISNENVSSMNEIHSVTVAISSLNEFHSVTKISRFVTV